MMAKKIKEDDLLTFVPRKPEVGVHKNADNLANLNPPAFRVVDSPCKDNSWVCELKNALELLLEGKRLEISNINTGLNMYDLKLKVRNIVFSYGRKNVEKKFTTQQINETTVAIDRHKNLIQKQ